MIPGNRGMADWNFPTVPVRRLTIPRRRQKNPRKEAAVLRNHPAAVGNRGTGPGDFLAGLRIFPGRVPPRLVGRGVLTPPSVRQARPRAFGGAVRTPRPTQCGRAALRAALAIPVAACSLAFGPWSFP